MFGWFLESSFRSFQNDAFYNAGFLYGPYCPIYGAACVFIYLIRKKFLHNGSSLLLKIFIYTVIATSVEYLTGHVFFTYCKIRLWDYSDSTYNLNGIISPLYTIFWAFISALYEAFLTKTEHWMNSLLERRFITLAILPLILIICIDFAVQIYALTSKCI